MNRLQGDWNCRSCHHLNFQRRDSCQRCGEPRPHDYYGGGGGGTRTSFSSSSSSSPFGIMLHFSTTTAAAAAASPCPGPDVRPGDWYCTLPNCSTHNFASRSTCFNCGALKADQSSCGGVFETDRPRARGQTLGGIGTSTSTLSNTISRFGWKSGDWICSRCNEHNFACRTECFRCHAPRELYGSSWSSHS